MEKRKKKDITLSVTVRLVTHSSRATLQGWQLGLLWLPSNFFALYGMHPSFTELNLNSNPTLRSPPLPPQSRYNNLGSGLFRSVHGQKRRTSSHGAAGVGVGGGIGTGAADVNRRQSWGHGSSKSVQGDYAVSVASAGSGGE